MSSRQALLFLCFLVAGAGVLIWHAGGVEQEQQKQSLMGNREAAPEPVSRPRTPGRSQSVGPVRLHERVGQLSVPSRPERLVWKDPDNPETGVRDQYQSFHVIYASGDEAGVPGVENARQARRWAEAAGVVPVQ